MKTVGLLAVTLFLLTLYFDQATARDCKYGGRTIKDMTGLLTNSCRKRHTCEKGKLNTYNFRCPANSHCKNGNCECKSGYEPKVRSRFGIIHACQVAVERKCKSGFSKVLGICVQIVNGHSDFMEARENCLKNGGIFHTTNNALQLYRHINESPNKGRRYFILGDRSLRYNNLEDVRIKSSQNFLRSMMAKYNIESKDMGRFFRRFTGIAKTADWNLVSPVSSLCLAIDTNGPNLVKCNLKLGYICEQAFHHVDYKDVFWTKFFDLGRPNRAGSKESLGVVLNRLNKYETKNLRLCRHPLQTECRQKNRNTWYSKGRTNGLKLKNPCQNNAIVCLNSQQRNRKRCPNFEIRFECPRNGDLNTCANKMMMSHCERKGQSCRNLPTGAECYTPKKKKNTSARLGDGVCVMGSQRLVQHVCGASGDPHYTTFDRKRYDFMGTCSYDFASTCNKFVPTESQPSFKIVQKNYLHNPRARPSYTKGFQFTVNGVDYLFGHGSFAVNGINTNAVGYTDDNIDTIRGMPRGARTFLIIHTKFCITIHWDNRWGLAVYLPETYKNHVCGLCGNYDGNAANDLILEGTNRMMNSNQINKKFAVASIFDNEGANCPPKVLEPKACSKAKKIQLHKPYGCGLLDVRSRSPIIQAMRDGASSAAYRANKKYIEGTFLECVNDMCWAPGTDRCHLLAAVISEMNRAFNFLTPQLSRAWTQYARCENAAEVKCNQKPNMVFQISARVNCLQSCANLQPLSECDDLYTEPSCVCKEGYVLDFKMNCVPRDYCSKTCSHRNEDGQLFTLNDGDEYVETPCKGIKVCKEGKLVDKNLQPCSVHATCKRGKTCQCNEGFVGNGHACESIQTCREGYTAVGEKCYKFVPQALDWHSAAINCGRDGSVLARYDDLVGENLLSYFNDIPKITMEKHAHTVKVLCKTDNCKFPRNQIGLNVKLSSNSKSCTPSHYRLVNNGKSLKVIKPCKGLFDVKLIKASKKMVIGDFHPWIAGNSFVVDQDQRKDKERFQIDPPQMLDLSVFKDPHGCFQAMVNEKGKLIVTPNPKCTVKKSSICEYDNAGKIPFVPNDFKGLNIKLTYSEAETACRRMGRPLVSPRNSEQLQVITRLIQKMKGNAWIGGRYNANKKVYIMSDNKPITTHKWRTGEPNNKLVEKCIAVQKTNGVWFTDNCNTRQYAICGPSNEMEAAKFTRYFQVKPGFDSLSKMSLFKRMLFMIDKYDYVCDNPVTIECRAKEQTTGDARWIVNHEAKAKGALICTKDKIQCISGRGFDCRNYQIRFLCPSDENQCSELKSENINPCTGGRVCLPVRNHYLCRCPGHFEWDKQNQKCKAPCGVCSASGDPHYITYSGMRYDFMGTCMYKFAGTCDLDELRQGPTFDVYTKNKKCGNKGASCIWEMEVHLRRIPYKKNGKDTFGNFVFKISRSDSNNYMYNGRKLRLGEFNIPGAVHVVRKYKYFSLFSEPLGLKVMFQRTKVAVNMPDKFIHKMCGLCGDCNTSKLRNKDLTLIEVATVTKTHYRNADIIPFTHQWIVPHPRTDPEKCKIVELLPECPSNMVLDLKKPDKCGIFKDRQSAIAPCFDAIDTTHFYDDCMVDACHEDVQKSICRSVKIYAQMCLKKGILLDWRHPGFCPIDCKSKVYTVDASCEPMCGRDMRADEMCIEEPDEGCVCPSGFMRLGEECVRPEKCGCEVIDGERAILVPPGESKLVSRCEDLVTCKVVADGNLQAVRESVTLGPNTICKEDPDSIIECVRGYILQKDGRTCIKQTKDCTDEYEDINGMCLQAEQNKQIWRQAVATCNDKGGTFAMINNADDINTFKKFLTKHNIKRAYIAGQVKVVVGAEGKVTFESVLSSQQQGNIEYYNFDYKELPIILSNELKATNLKGKGMILALVFSLSETGDVTIEAVPRDTVASVVCKERYVKPKEEQWFGPCNSDRNMEDGDLETRLSLKQRKCPVCPVPMEVRCNKVDNAPGTATGECKMTNKGVYYSCDKGKECIDHNVETKCAKDINECAENLHDCPASSKCQNVVGAYICKCNEDKPLMIAGHCYPKTQCEMEVIGSQENHMYKLRGLPGRQGSLYYNCQFQIFATCKERNDMNSKLPDVTLGYAYGLINGKTTRFLLGAFGQGKNKKHFALADNLLKEGKFMFGPPGNLTVHSVGFSSIATQTSFSLLPPNGLYIRQLENYYRIIIESSIDMIKIEASPDYRDKICGVCRLQPLEADGQYQITDAIKAEISRGLRPKKLKQCGSNPEPEETTTPAPTTPVPTEIQPTQKPNPQPTPVPTEIQPTQKPNPQPTPVPTEIQPTQKPNPQPTPVPTEIQPTQRPGPQPTPEPITAIQPTEVPNPEPQPGGCEDDNAINFCRIVNDLCSIDIEACIEDLCNSASKFCPYLLTTKVKECKSSPKMDAFLKSINNCEGVCRGENMNFEVTNGEPPEKCQTEEDKESASSLSSFGCRCEDGYKLSGKNCVIKEDCGCTLKDGTYLEKATMVITSECRKKVVCMGNNDVMNVPMRCSKNSECVSTKNGPQCKCKKGFYGDAEEEEGCKKPAKEDNTMICYKTTSDEGIKQTTCTCKKGYASNCTACVDINECNENTHDCDLSKEKCENVPGSFKCSCGIGFTPFNGDCKDIDECTNGQARCDQHEGCINTPGSYECACCGGFKYNLEARKCQLDPNSGVRYLVSSKPKCCLTCDNPKLCEEAETNPQPYCVSKDGKYQQFPNYKAMFLHHCVNNINLPQKSFHRGPCPQVQPPKPSGPSPPGGVTGGSGGGGNPGSETGGPPKSCWDAKFCQKIPSPPSSLSRGPVCGPSFMVRKKTFLSYCEMVREVCMIRGTGSISKGPIDGRSGRCFDFTTTPKPPPTPKPEPETPGTKPGPSEETTKEPSNGPIEPSDPLITEWSGWSRCRLDNNAMPCGQGMQSRFRQVIPYDDDREVKKVNPSTLYEERVCFKPCDPKDPAVTPEHCGEPGICGDVDDKVCGSLGAGAATTYDNECELNVAACKLEQKPNVVQKGPCEATPKEMCSDGPEEVVVKNNGNINGLDCVSEEKIIKKCSSRVCPGGFNNCCVATGYEKIYVKKRCSNKDGQGVRSHIQVILSAINCRCTNESG